MRPTQQALSRCTSPRTLMYSATHVGVGSSTTCVEVFPEAAAATSQRERLGAKEHDSTSRGTMESRRCQKLVFKSLPRIPERARRNNTLVSASRSPLSWLVCQPSAEPHEIPKESGPKSVTAVCCTFKTCVNGALKKNRVDRARCNVVKPAETRHCQQQPVVQIC